MSSYFRKIYKKDVNKHLVDNVLRKSWYNVPHYAKTDLDKKSGAMHQALIYFNIDAQRFRKKNENPPTREIGVTS